MTLEALSFFDSGQGREILLRHRDVPAKDLPRLVVSLARHSTPFAAEIATMLRLRLAASGKFSRAQSMYFTADGLEQASGERISRYLASRFVRLIGKGVIADLTCGIGGSAIFLAEHFTVRAVDIDPVHLACARHNVEQYGVAGDIAFVQGRAEENLGPADAFFIDPQRIRSGRTKTRSLRNSQPDITGLLPRMLEYSKDICIKISPAFDYAEIAALPGEPEIEVVSEEDNNKAALLWFGRLKEVGRRATILDGDSPVSLDDSIPDDDVFSLASPERYIFIPNKAIAKAGLVGQVASRYGLARLGDDLLSGEAVPDLPPRLLRSLAVEAWDDFSIKKAKEMLARLGWTRAEIVVRGVRIGAEELRKKLKLQEGGGHTLVAAEVSGRKQLIAGTNI